MKNQKYTEPFNRRPDVIWHISLAILLLISVVSFFYLRYQLTQRAERESEELEQIFALVPSKQDAAKNIGRWHDSNLIFAAIKKFQVENENSFPAAWSDDLLDRRRLIADRADRVITIQTDGLSAASLPAEGYFHIWPGRICSAYQPAIYWERVEGFAYNQVILEGETGDFAIVYGAEGPANRYDDDDEAAYFRCLDSFEDPSFIFKHIEFYDETI